MTAREEMSETIERLEAAGEGRRDLDFVIWRAVAAPTIYFGQPVTAIIWNAGETVIKTADGFTHFDSHDVPHYTTSIDAALTLLPEGRSRRSEYLPAASWPYRVWIFRDAFMPLEENSGTPTLGRTEALALCIACLRARQP